MICPGSDSSDEASSQGQVAVQSQRSVKLKMISIEVKQRTARTANTTVAYKLCIDTKYILYIEGILYIFLVISRGRAPVKRGCDQIDQKLLFCFSTSVQKVFLARKFFGH